ncbi:MAG: hypothetical protein Q8Q39_00430 [bacterium]|nr:hypothetical protein [bacterium]
MKKIFAAPLELLRAVRWAYVPLFLGYFAHAFSGMFGMGSGLTTIPADFWIQQRLGISPEALAFMSFTISLPWISKIIIGQLVDSWTIKKRKRVLFFSGTIMMGGFVLLAALAGEYGWLMKLQPAFFADPVSFRIFFLTLGYLLVSATMCLQDVILDPMGRHLVSKAGANGQPLSDKDYQYKVGLVQVWCRISFNVASILGMTVAGIMMARGVQMDGIFLAALCVPVMTVLLIQFIRLPHDVEPVGVNKRIIIPALCLIVFAIITQLKNVPFSEEATFLITLGVVIYLIRALQKKSVISPEDQRSLLFTAATLSCLAIVPGVGNGVSWWMRDELGFTRQFETQLGVFGGILSLVLLFFVYRMILRGHLGYVLCGMIILFSAFGSITLMFWHGVHVWLGSLLGVDPLIVVRWVTWINTAASSPMALLYGMIMFIFLAQYANDKGTATWFTVFAVLFNLSMSGSNLLTGYLNRIFVVKQGEYDALGNLISPGNYTELGNILWTSWVIGLMFPLIAILLFYTPWRKSSDPIAYTLWRRFKK